MQTINSQINFTGIYKIPNTPKNIKEIEEKVIPMYSYLKHEKVSGFPGENPFVLGFETIKEIVANKNNASKIWLEMNAKNHGQILPDTNTNFLHIISGEKDLQEFLEFIIQRLKANENTPLNRLKHFFNSLKNINREKQKLPEHLQLVDKAIELYKKERLEYQKFIQNKNVISVSSAQELLAKMLTEK